MRWKPPCKYRKQALERARQIKALEWQLHEAQQQQYLWEYLQQLATRLAGKGDCAVLLPEVIKEICAIGYPAAALLMYGVEQENDSILTGELVTVTPCPQDQPLHVCASQAEISVLLQAPIQDLADPIVQSLYNTETLTCLHSLEIRQQLSLPIEYQKQ